MNLIVRFNFIETFKNSNIYFLIRKTTLYFISNVQFLVCKNYNDETGNDGTAAWSASIVRREFTLTEF